MEPPALEGTWAKGKYPQKTRREAAAANSGLKRIQLSEYNMEQGQILGKEAFSASEKPGTESLPVVPGAVTTSIQLPPLGPGRSPRSSIV